jgi:hypothetical protein
MKKTRFSVEQIVGELKDAEVGVPVAELIHNVGISPQTIKALGRPRSHIEDETKRGEAIQLR